MRIKVNLYTKLGIIAVSLILIAFTIITISKMTTALIANIAQNIYNHDVKSIRYAKEMELQMQTGASSLQYAAIHNYSPEKVRQYEKQFEGNIDDFLVAAEEFKKTTQTEKETELIEIAINAAKEYKVIGKQVCNYHAAQDTQAANTLAETKMMEVRQKRLIPAINELIEIQNEEGETTYNYVISHTAASSRFLNYVMIFGLIISILLCYFIGKSIVRPLKNTANTLSEASNQIETSSYQLSETSQEIASGSQEQAASIEETSASIEELASMIQQNLLNSKQASALATKTAEESETGNTNMKQMIEAMKSIQKSSQEINSIIDVIDDIAFQTNMLALNAAVEAARAGEAGMGFSVVATEVKNLANRSSQSAKESTEMIKQILKNVDFGVTVAKDLEQNFSYILEDNSKVLDMNREVENASSQQEEGISQINKAMSQVDAVVQANAAGAEETASASEELHSQVNSMKEVVEELQHIING